MNQPLPPATGPLASAAAPAVTAVGSAAPVTAPQPVAAAAPAAPVSALNLSSQAQQALRLQVFEKLIAQLVSQIQSGVASWPTAGVSQPLREMLTALIAAATANLPQPQKLIAAQAWPQSWLNSVLPGAAAATSAAQPAAVPAVMQAAVQTAVAPAADSETVPPRLPPMQNWLVQQGLVQTPQGERSFALTLQVPQAWAQLQAAAPPAAAVAPTAAAAGLAAAQAPSAIPGAIPLSPAAALSAAMPAAAPLRVPFAASLLESGVLALVLEGPGPQPLRTSALLWLDFQPLANTAAAPMLSAQLAQHAGLQPKNDPWLQLQALQASGQQPREALPDSRTGLCKEIGCPYRGKASCAQPFCAEMNRVWAAARIGPTAT